MNAARAYLAMPVILKTGLLSIMLGQHNQLSSDPHPGGVLAMYNTTESTREMHVSLCARVSQVH